MPNTSGTGGYLVPSTSAPPEDDAFENLIGGAISGIAGIDRILVRPRWQAEPPPMPAIDVSWCAFGITEIVADWSAATVHQSAGDGSDEVTRHDTVRTLASFYGPLGYSKASQTRDGLWVPQNWEQLRAAGVALYEAGPIRTASDLINERFIRRIDIELVFRRAVTRTYPVLNLLSAQGSFRTDLGYVQPFTVEQ